MKSCAILFLIGSLSFVSAQGTPTSSVLGELLFVPGGTFQRDGRPENTTTVDAFLMCRHEVTQEQYLAVTGLPNPSKNKKDQQNPVESLSFYEAMIFCNRLSLREGLEPVYRLKGSGNPDDWGKVPKKENDEWDAALIVWDASGYRLPTVAEWQWAALGANDGAQRFYSGMSLGSEQDAAWYLDNSGEKTHPVGQKKPNELGLYDLSGNVYEMCIAGKEAARSGPQVNPMKDDAPPVALAMCGGGFPSKAMSLNLRFAVPYWTYDRYPYLGFRVVRNKPAE